MKTKYEKVSKQLGSYNNTIRNPYPVLMYWSLVALISSFVCLIFSRPSPGQPRSGRCWGPLAKLFPSPPHRASSASPSPRLSSHRLKGSIIDTGVSNAIIPPTIDYYCACPPIIVSYCGLLGRRTAWMLGRTPPWAMVTPASSLFNSSSFLMASWRWRGMILVFFLSREPLPANSRN